MSAGRDLVVMCADTGAVVALTESAGTLRTVVFLTTGETLWAVDTPRRPVLAAGGRSVRLSTVAAVTTSPAHVVRGEPLDARTVPLNLALTADPAAMEVSLPTPARLVRVAGTVTVGSVIHRVDGHGWSSPTTGAARARAVFQDGSALFAAAGDTAAALVVNTAARPVPLAGLTVEGPTPPRRLRCDLSGRRPATVRAEIRDTEQHLTYVEPSPDGAGWLTWTATPAVFVRAGLTGLGLVERTAPAASPRPAPTTEGLPDPY